MEKTQYSNIYHDPLVKVALSKYELSPFVQVTLLHRSENDTYLIKDEERNEKMILRLNRPKYHTRSALNGEIEWIQDILKNSSIIVPEPVAGINGEYVQQISSELGKERFCLMFTFLDGEQLEDSDISTLEGPFERLGFVTAQLHDHSSNWQRSRSLTRFEWNFETMIGNSPRWGTWRNYELLSIKDEALFAEVSRVIYNRLQCYGMEKDRFGLIHADLRLANILVDGDDVKVIDFDDSGYSWYLFDLASAMTFLEMTEETNLLVSAWIRGYERVRALKEADREEVPTFLMMRRLMTLSWLISHKESDVAKEVPIKSFIEETRQLARQYLQRMGEE